MDTKHYGLIVFGGGNAISIAIDCGAKGMNVALVEKGQLGGTCPHRGCIPSKLLIGYADAAALPPRAEFFKFAPEPFREIAEGLLSDAGTRCAQVPGSSACQTQNTKRLTMSTNGGHSFLKPRFLEGPSDLKELS